MPIQTSASANKNVLHHLAFENSCQPNLITVVSDGKIIAANNAICKLLGYSKKEIAGKNKADIFSINESSYKRMLGKRTSEGHSKGLVTTIKKSGKLITCEVTSCVFTDNGIDKAITTFSDMTTAILKQKSIAIKRDKITTHNIVLAEAKQKRIDTKNAAVVAKNIVQALAKADARLEENNKWKKHIAMASYDVMWDWDVTSDHIYVGDSVKEVFGYEVQNNVVSLRAFRHCLVGNEKQKVEKKIRIALASGKNSWKDSYMFIKKDGSIAFTTSRAIIVRNDEGKAIRLIGATQDVSKLKGMEKKLKEQITVHKELSEVFMVAAKLSFNGRWDWDILTNDFYLGEGFEELFGYSAKSGKGSIGADWSKHLHPEDREAVENGLQNAITSSASYWEHAYRFIRADGSIAQVINRASIIRLPDGKAHRVVGAIQDISKQKVLEEKLEKEIQTKEKQIAEAQEGAKETTRADIGKELHDNVNQLLGASKLYIEMAQRDGSNRALFLSRSSEYTLTAIEEIRRLTKGLTTDIITSMGLCEAITKVINDTMEVQAVKIFLAAKNFSEGSINEKVKINIFRMVQEQLNNILKHAHARKVFIRLSQDEAFITLSVSDNGIGFVADKKRAGIGLSNIQNRAAAFQGTACIVSEPGKGCSLIVKLPVSSLVASFE